MTTVQNLRSSDYRAWAGIGSRETPPRFRPVMETAARRLTELGYTLRSGRATGADTFFENGAGPCAELFVPSGRHGALTPAGATILVPSGTGLDKATLLASVAHPTWGRCGEYARLLLSRNVCQVHGLNLDSPVDFLVCWAPPGPNDSVKGGTNLAWQVAGFANIRRFNLAVPDEEASFGRFIDTMTELYT